MEYRTTIPFDGDCTKAIDIARSVFINNNFKIESLSRSEIVARGSGMQSTKQNPLVGATLVRITVKPSLIDLSAELGGVRWMRNFLFIFPPSLALTISIVFLILPMPAFVVFVPWLAVSPWLIISPLLAKWIKSRTISALDTMLHNMKTEPIG